MIVFPKLGQQQILIDFLKSNFSHASFRFGSLDRVKAILSETKSPKILGKKVYVFPAYICLLADMPKLGETWTGDQKAAAKSVDAALVCFRIEWCYLYQMLLHVFVIFRWKIPNSRQAKNWN